MCKYAEKRKAVLKCYCSPNVLEDCAHIFVHNQQIQKKPRIKNSFQDSQNAGLIEAIKHHFFADAVYKCSVECDLNVFSIH